MTRNRAAFILAAACIASPGLAFAACEPRGAALCASGAPQIRSPDGLQVSRGGRFSPLPDGRPLRVGDRILTGSAPSTLSLGATCTAPVGPGSLVSITRIGGRTCARVTGGPSPASQAGLTGPGPVAAPGALVGVGVAAGVAALGIGVGVATSGGTPPAPPPTVSAQ